MVLYEMLTGRVPFEAENPVAVAMKHVTEPPRPPTEVNPKVPQEIEAVTMKLLAKNPEERYKDATELLGDLERVRSGLSPAIAGTEEAGKITAPLPAGVEERMQKTTVEPPPTAPITAPERAGKRPGRLLAVVLAALLLVLLGGAWALTQGFFGAGSVDVPSLEGLTREEAQVQLAGSGLALGEVGEAPSNSAPTGTVIEQDPQAGTSAKPETPVNVTLSSGPERVTVPDLSGMSLSGVTQALSGAALKLGRQGAAPSDTVPAGAVAQQNPAKGEEAQPGTAVDVVVSTGPQQKATPAQAPTQQAAQQVPVVRGDDDKPDKGNRGKGNGGGRDKGRGKD
jgi:serine/threonine-protein kinase